MVSVIFWIFLLLIFLVIANHTSGKILLTPQFGFIACFIPQAIYALFYVDKWDLELSFNTFVVLILGGSSFLLVSILMARLPGGRIKTRLDIDSTEANSNMQITIERWKIFALLLFQIVVVALMLRYIMRLPGGSFAEKLFFRDYTSKRVEGGLSEAGLDLPSYLSVARAFSYYSGFITSYLVLHEIIYKYKAHRVLLVTCYAMSILSSLLLGQRFGVYSLAVATFVQWYFIRGKKNNWGKVLSPKILGRVLVIMFLAMFLFVQLGNFIGKGTRTTVSDYIATYLAAQLKNLDTYVRGGNFGCGIENWQTLYAWVNWIASTFGISSWKHFYDQPFYRINGYSLGNVSTVLYWFMHDGGYIGVIIFTSIMAFISHLVFRRVIKDRRKKSIDLSLVIYSYLFYGIVFSFYSNRFYSTLSPDFWKFLLSLYVLRWYFTKLRVRFSKKSISRRGLINV